MLITAWASIFDILLYINKSILRETAVFCDNQSITSKAAGSNGEDHLDLFSGQTPENKSYKAT